jgi:PEP-CTERM motif
MAKAASRARNKGKRGLKNYALVAGAAVTLPVGAYATPIYTPLNIVIPGTPTGNSYLLDVNGDNIPDLLFVAQSDFLGLTFAKNAVFSASASYAIETFGLNQVPSDLLPGTVVNTLGNFGGLQPGVLSKELFAAEFPIDGKTPGYLGFTYNDADGTHYGYVQLTTLLGNPIIGTDKIIIQGVGFESSPNTTIVARDVTATPEPGTLGLFALGAVGLGMLRRWRSQPAKKSRLQ